MRFLILCFMVALCASSFAQQPASRWPKAIVPDPNADARHELLLSHGINPEPAALVSFLQEGFNLAAVPAGLPKDPKLKSKVVNAAVEELGVTGAQEGVAPIIEIARKTGPAAVQRLIRRDFEDLPVQAVDQEVASMQRLISLNAVVALGLIGDPQAKAAILEVMNTETGSAFITKGAEAIGLMNSSEGMPGLVKLAAAVESDESAAAFESIFFLTGRNYGYTENTPLAQRRELVSQLNEWYNGAGKSLPVYREEVLRRRQSGVPGVPLEPGSLRQLLRDTVNAGASFDARYNARQKLGDIAADKFDDIRKIAEDPKEELDIRRAALRWLAVGNAKDAKSVLKRAQKDENPSVVKMAEEVEKDLDVYRDEQRQKKSK
ncbi:hypothetical protein BH09SUM1_BH09SUM1_28390 [soil metagenome]